MYIIIYAYDTTLLLNMYSMNDTKNLMFQCLIISVTIVTNIIRARGYCETIWDNMLTITNVVTVK